MSPVVSLEAFDIRTVLYPKGDGNSVCVKFSRLSYALGRLF
jgi:hypothetical protein